MQAEIQNEWVFSIAWRLSKNGSWRPAEGRIFRPYLGRCFAFAFKQVIAVLQVPLVELG